MAFIEFKNIHKYFDEKHVLKGIDMTIEEGEFVTLLGSSGCGKSTLLRCLSGLESVTEGEIYLKGEKINDKSPKERGIGMVFQQYSLFPNMTVGQNVAFGLEMKKEKKEVIKQKVQEVLEMVGLASEIDKYPHQLSGGMQQRVALARAIAPAPAVLLLDEPLSAIDALLRRELQIEIRRIQKELGITAIFVTHDQDEAMVMSDTIYLFNGGVIEQAGTPEEIYAYPQTEFAANFIGHYNILSAAELAQRSTYTAASEKVAIRPEAIKIKKEQEAAEDCICVEGVIKNSISRGSTVVYTVDCGGMIINADRLFSPNSTLAAGSTVYLQIPKSDILVLR